MLGIGRMAVSIKNNLTFPHYLCVLGVASLGLFVVSTFEEGFGLKDPDLRA